MRTPSRRPLVLLVGAALALSACSSSDATPDAETAAGYPREVENCGRTTAVTAPPERIVSLNQGSTEILLSLGLADRMAGTSTWTDPVMKGLEEDNAKVERLADSAPSMERVLQTEPDLVTASFASVLGQGGVGSADAFEKLGVPTYLSPAECEGKENEGDGDGARTGVLEIDTIYREVTELAELLDVEAQGEELVASLQDRVAAASAKAPEDEVTVLYWFANSEAPYMAGCCGGPGIITRALGLKNVFDDTKSEWPQIGWETVAERDPDVLVIGDLTRKSQTAETAKAKIEFLETNPVTREMTAVRNRRYVALTGAALNPSIRTVEGLEQVADALADFGLSR
ncbi:MULTISPECIES: ABC transporter substrate-binding protein [Aeromicrobium]|uniref:ABC transporter substrate-binding protein n=1 Tax=Aeromicrobium TaxID=2040 RepID=UPI002579FA67|nr:MULTISPECIES: ABC transporter substrate-binding protein [Aeromicrobium]